MFCIIPMEPIPNHSFFCTIPIDDGNTLLKFRLTYNELLDFWSVDVFKNETEVLSRFPLIPSENILEQFHYLRIGSAWIVPKSEAQTREEWPTANTLSSDWYMVWGDTDAAT